MQPGAPDPSSLAVMPQFGSVYALEPQSRHTHSVILLHGRGSTGEEFAEEILSPKLSTGMTLPEQLPSCRWVFPSSRELWSTAFEETMPAWFEAHSLTDITARQDLQMDGIRESMAYLTHILDKEIEDLGEAGRVVLGGISQGGAIGLWTLLCACAGGDKTTRHIGGFLAGSTWLPFAMNLERNLTVSSAADANIGIATSDDAEISVEADAFVESMTAPTKKILTERGSSEPPLLSIPVFLGHGIDDAYVDIELGRQAAYTLRKIGLKVEWHEYSGAEQEGHWLKEPEELDDIIRFLVSTLSLS
ncbi:Alpha/Beta hydrolase protein [Xylariales sp. AK1849]|nr:Alpha/Beta hydrolase protein [Xylariales sp. AK1849]